MIFLGVTGSIASAIIYDKWQTRKTREKWCKLVSHVADESLDSKTMPRRLTIYLSAPPGDGLRSAREHFHTYVKPILVAAAMDWDVVEGRKEGDVRFKTAERVRRRRRHGGEGTAIAPEDNVLEQMRDKSGTVEYPGVSGDLIVGRHTWKEYVRGLHEGWLGPVDPPPGPKTSSDEQITKDTQVGGLAPVEFDAEAKTVPEEVPLNPAAEGADGETPAQSPEITEKPSNEKEAEEETPKPRQPPPYIDPGSYASATVSTLMPDTIGPSAALRFPHILGIRNTPIRLYRFFTRRRLADDIGREVASAILANHQAYGVSTVVDDNAASVDGRDVPEQAHVLGFEEKEWWKTVHEPRKEHEESVLIESVVLDERITSRMRRFSLRADDEDRAKTIATGKEVLRAEDGR